MFIHTTQVRNIFTEMTLLFQRPSNRKENIYQGGERFGKPGNTQEILMVREKTENFVSKQCI